MKATKSSAALLIIIWISSWRGLPNAEGVPTSPSQCAERDRDALLRFKAGIVQDPAGALRDWEGQHCCQWNGIRCDPLTGRVTKILLRAFSPAQHIRGLLSESISNLTYLNQLRLVGWKSIGGKIPAAIFSLPNLHSLALDGNALWGAIPPSIGNASNLRVLSLANNRLTGEIPATLGRLPGLTEVALGGNALRGPIPEALGNLSRLCYLDLSRNGLAGPVPGTFQNLWSLLQLDLSHNRLSNPLPNLANFSIYSLDLSHNNLQMVDGIPDWITLADSVNALGLGGCGIRMRLDRWRPLNPASYSRIDLSGNEITGSVEGFFRGMAYLEYADLSGNRLASDLTNVSFSDHLRVVDLRSNGLYGELNSLLGRAGQPCGRGGCLGHVDLSENRLSGRMPRVINQRNLKWLGLAGNALTGSIPPSIGRMKAMEYVDLSRNKLSGRIPREVANMKRLRIVNVSYNRLCGEIPRGSPLNALPVSAYSHNDCLCGAPLPRCNNWF